MYRRLLATASLWTALWIVSAPASANLVVNGGFEELDGSGFTGWTITGNGIGQDSVFPNTGTYDAIFTDVNGTSPLSVLSQTVATSPGGEYTLSFSLLDESGLSTDSFIVGFGGFNVTITGDEAAPPGTDASFYTAFSFSIPGSAVAGSLTTLTFSGSVDPSSGTAFDLDDVGMVGASGGTVPVPEPGSLVVVSGLAAVVWSRRRRKRGAR